jgi:hypothetical protein
LGEMVSFQTERAREPGYPSVMGHGQVDDNAPSCEDLFDNNDESKIAETWRKQEYFLGIKFTSVARGCNKARLPDGTVFTDDSAPQMLTGPDLCVLSLSLSLSRSPSSDLHLSTSDSFIGPSSV